jgi:hypothetical protein
VLWRLPSEVFGDQREIRLCRTVSTQATFKFDD